MIKSKITLHNVFDKTNLYHILNVMFKMKNKAFPSFLGEKFISINHRYPTRYSENNFQVPIPKLKITDHAIISLWGPRIYLDRTYRHPIKDFLLKSQAKKLLIFKNKVKYS